MPKSYYAPTRDPGFVERTSRPHAWAAESCISLGSVSCVRRGPVGLP